MLGALAEDARQALAVAITWAAAHLQGTALLLKGKGRRRCLWRVGRLARAGGSRACGVWM